jgi:hypothetical protein
MKLEELRRALATWLCWMTFLCLGLILAMSGTLPLRLAILERRNLNVLLLETEIFFLLLVWPLFIPMMVQHLQGRRDRCLQLLIHGLILLLLSFPLALVTHFVSRAEATVLLAGRLLAAAAALFVVGFFGLGQDRRERLSRAYFLLLLILTGALPYAHFILTRAADAGVAAWFSPLWSASRLNAAPGLPLTSAAIFGGVGAALVGMSFLRRHPNPAAELSGR